MSSQLIASVTLLIARIRKDRALADAVGIGGAMIVIFAIVWMLDAFDNISNFITRHETEWGLGEILLFIIVASLAGVFYSVRRLKDLQREVRRRESAEAEADRLAHEDPLTGLPNRRSFNTRLDRIVERSATSSSPVAVLLIDLDDFKNVNDVHGHAAGDQLLVTVADRISEVLTPEDCVARLGGDEFAIVARSATSSEEAARLTFRLTTAICQPILIDEVQLEVGASIGIAMYPSDGLDRSTLLKRADIALYRAKQEGRSEIRFFEESMGLMVSRRANLERALRRAIHDDQIEIYYQPLIDLKGGRIVAFEALARWDHPDLGDVPPSSFIQIAEDFGLITPLSDLLLRKACREAVRWPSDITLAFNISATQLRDKLLGLRILGILADTGLSPHRLQIEITESAVVKEYKAAQLIIDELRAAGIRISLDDFGTGYSSLSQLSRFKFDQIKIDPTFIKNMLEDGDQAMLVKAVIGLGRGLGLATVGEGIENPNQLAFLREAGCELGQGFLFSKAVPAEETLRLTLKKDGTTPAHKQARA